MKKIIKTLAVFLIAIGFVVSVMADTSKKEVVATTVAESVAEKSSAQVYITNVERVEGKGVYTDFSDGSWSLENRETGVYIFQPVDLGDWCYELDSADELQKITLTYMTMSNTGSF